MKLKNNETIISTLLVFVAHILSSQFFISYAYRDEALYLINAAQLAGFHNNFSNYYGIGFSVLLAPFFMFEQYISPYNIAIIINSLCLAGIFYSITVIAKHEKFEQPLLLAIVVSAYPTLWLYGRHALPEISLTFILFVMYVMLIRGANNSNTLELLFFNVLGSFCFLLHPRMAIVPAACVFLMAIIFICQPAKRVIVLSCVGLLLSILAIGLYLKHFSHSQQSLEGLRIIDPYVTQGFGIVDALRNKPLVTLFAFISSISGQILYVWMSTFGLSLIGLYHLVNIKMCFSGNKYNVNIEQLLQSFPNIFILITFLGVLFISGVQKIPSTLLDQFIFGRYIDVFTPILIAFGLIRLSKRTPSAIDLVSILAIGSFLLFFVFLRSDDIVAALSNRERFWTIPSVSYLFFLFHKIDIKLFFISSCTLIIILFLVLYYFKNRIFTISIFIFFAFQVILLNYNSYSEYVVKRLSWRNSLAAVMRTHNIEDEPCVGYDLPNGVTWLTWDFGVTYFEKELRFIDIEGHKYFSCSKVFFSKKENLNISNPNIVLLDKIKCEPTLYLYSLNTESLSSIGFTD